MEKYVGENISEHYGGEMDKLKAETLIKEYRDAYTNLETTSKAFAEYHLKQWEDSIKGGSSPYIFKFDADLVNSVSRHKYVTLEVDKILHVGVNDWIREWSAWKVSQAGGGWFDGLEDHELWMIEAWKKWAYAKINMNEFLEYSKNNGKDIVYKLLEENHDITIYRDEYIAGLKRKLEIIDLLMNMLSKPIIDKYWDDQVAWKNVYKRKYEELENASGD